MPVTMELLDKEYWQFAHNTGAVSVHYKIACCNFAEMS